MLIFVFLTSEENSHIDSKPPISLLQSRFQKVHPGQSVFDKKKSGF